MAHRALSILGNEIVVFFETSHSCLRYIFFVMKNERARHTIQCSLHSAYYLPNQRGER